MGYNSLETEPTVCFPRERSSGKSSSGRSHKKQSLRTRSKPNDMPAIPSALLDDDEMMEPLPTRRSSRQKEQAKLRKYGFHISHRKIARTERKADKDMHFTSLQLQHIATVSASVHGQDGSCTVLGLNGLTQFQENNETLASNPILRIEDIEDCVTSTVGAASQALQKWLPHLMSPMDNYAPSQKGLNAASLPTCKLESTSLMPLGNLHQGFAVTDGRLSKPSSLGIQSVPANLDSPGLLGSKREQLQIPRATGRPSLDEPSDFPRSMQQIQQMGEQNVGVPNDWQQTVGNSNWGCSLTAEQAFSFDKRFKGGAIDRGGLRFCPVNDSNGPDTPDRGREPSLRRGRQLSDLSSLSDQMSEFHGDLLMHPYLPPQGSHVDLGALNMGPDLVTDAWVSKMNGPLCIEGALDGENSLQSQSSQSLGDIWDDHQKRVAQLDCEYVALKQEIEGMNEAQGDAMLPVTSQEVSAFFSEGLRLEFDENGDFAFLA